MENLSAIIEAILFVSGDPVRTDALYYQSLNATQRRPDAPLATVGSFAFYNS